MVVPLVIALRDSNKSDGIQNQRQKARKAKRSELVRKVEVPSFGTIEEFDGTAGKVVYVETFWGKHNEVGLQEGVQDVMSMP